jgi:hypothetical protein
MVPTEVSEGRGRPSAPVRLYVGLLNTNSTFSCHWQDARAFIVGQKQLDDQAHTNLMGGLDNFILRRAVCQLTFA